MRRSLACLGVVGVALVAALPAAGKEAVKATLTTRISLTAPAGTKMRIAWTLTYRDQNGRRQTFGGEGIFVRLLGTSSSTTAFAHGTSGGYAATVMVPGGGIRSIQIGIRGWSSGPNGMHRADELFPITNRPASR